MYIIHVTKKVELDALYAESALTWEGLAYDEENLNAVKNWLNQHGALIDDGDDDEPFFYIISGKLMNDVYGLTGDNAYPEDCTLVSVTDIDQMKIALPRFEVGGRWFDDIVDNNRMREESNNV